MKYYLKALRHYADFNGRASRKEYWMFILFNVIFIFAAAFLGAIIGVSINQKLAQPYAIVFTMMYYFAVAIPFLAVTVRRLHDSGKSGWWLLLPMLAQALNLTVSSISGVDEGLVIFVSVLAFAASVCILVLMLLGSNENANRYGQHPSNIMVYDRHTFTRSLGLTLIISMAMSVVAIILRVILINGYFEFMAAHILNFLSSNIIVYLLVMAAGIALLCKKEINATFALLLIAAALLWIFKDIYFGVISTGSDELNIPLGMQIMRVLNKLLLIVPIALLMAGMAYLNKSKPDMAIIKMNPRIAALSLIGVLVFWIVYKIYFIIAVPIQAILNTNIINMVDIVIPVAFITLATYLLRGYDLLPSETTVAGGSDAQKYENRQHIKAPNTKMHLAFSILNIVMGVLFLLPSIVLLIEEHNSSGIVVWLISLILSLFLLIAGSIYVLQRKKDSQTLRKLNHIAAVISFILIALIIIGIIVAALQHSL
jgi:uncharacterized membrane protein YhaH (DUF805 family)